MATQSYEQLISGANKIKQNELPESNTATLVGEQLLQMVNKQQEESRERVKGITEYNVSVQHPTSGIDGSNKYILEGAIAQVPPELRNIGLKVSFVNSEGKVETWEFQGGTFTNMGRWLQSGGNHISKVANYININEVFGNPPDGYYTLATAIKKIISPYNKLGLRIVYRTGAGTWEIAQYIGSSASISDPYMYSIQNWRIDASGVFFLDFDTAGASPYDRRKRTRVKLPHANRKRGVSVMYYDTIHETFIHETYTGTSSADTQFQSDGLWSRGFPFCENAYREKDAIIYNMLGNEDGGFSTDYIHAYISRSTGVNKGVVIENPNYTMSNYIELEDGYVYEISALSSTGNNNIATIGIFDADYFCLLPIGLDSGYNRKTFYITKTGNEKYFAISGSGAVKRYKLSRFYQPDKSDHWRGKRLLAIGDSMTAVIPVANSWQYKVSELLNMNIRTHAKGGIGILAMVDGDGSGTPPEGSYDPDTGADGKLYALSAEDVADVDVIALMGFYNERYGAWGESSDMYPTQNTFCGRLNYAVKRVYDELANANNMTCKVVIISAHKYGKYSYNDKSAYDDGEELFEATKKVANYNSLPLIDLMHNGGINRFNWNTYQASDTPYNAVYLPSNGSNDGTNKPFESIGAAPSASENTGRVITVAGESGSYKSDGSQWLKQGNTAPWNADQLHLNKDGYHKIAGIIAGKLNDIMC